MRTGARTPEELEDLLEDAFVTQDAAALGSLFADGAVLVAEREGPEVRGGAEITLAAADLWRRRLTYLAGPDRVLQSRDTALIVARRGLNVVRRDTDGAWRYAISLLDREPPSERNGT